MQLDVRIPFAAAFAPWVDAARSQLPASPHISGTAVEGLAAALVRRLSGFGSLAALELFERARSSGDTYDSFTASAADRLVDNYPGFERIALQACTGWVAATRALISRTEADLHDIAPHATQVTEIESGLGDPHRGNHQVALVTFDDGTQRYYKPRSVQPEAVFFELADRAGDLIPQPPMVWDRGTHGWMSPVLEGPVVDAEGYWHRVGRMVRLLQVFGATDLHLSNVICTGEQLVPVDLECFLTPEIVVRDEGDAAARFQRDSAMLTGLLPRLEPRDGPVAVDWSGLTGRSGQLNGRWRPTWMDLGSCDIRRAQAPMQTPPASNMAVDTNGSAVPLQIDALLAGYADEQHQLNERDLDLDQLHGLSSRVILRPTAVYASCLASLSNPDVLRSENAIEHAATLLQPFDEILASALGSAVDDVCSAEEQSLTQLDIPLFMMRGQSMDLDGRTERTIPCRTGVEGLVDRRARAADPGWQRANAALVQVALEAGTGQLASGPTAARQQSRTPLENRGDALCAAKQIGHGLLHEAVELGNGQLGWADAVPYGASGRLRIALDPPGIYNGRSGIAVFLAALASVTGEDRWSEAARAAIDSDPPRLRTTYESGLAGYAWATAAVAQLLNDDTLMDVATSIALEVEIPKLEECDGHVKLDLVGGLAGTVAALTSVAMHSDHPETTQQAVEGGRLLAALVSRSLDDEIERRDIVRLGMAHGSTGIIHALGAVSQLATDTGIAAAQKRLVQLENERVERRNGIGGRIDEFGRRRSPSCTWCWGVSGYLLARSMSWFDSECDEHRPSLEASHAALSEGLSRHGHTCCGNAGQLEAALAAEQLGLCGAGDTVDERIRVLTTETQGAPFHSSTAFSSPSLFRGRAGVGLALLRSAMPDTWLPNPLVVH